jgi:hypothetical protein
MPGAMSSGTGHLEVQGQLDGAHLASLSPRLERRPEGWLLHIQLNLDPFIGMVWYYSIQYNPVCSVLHSIVID